MSFNPYETRQGRFSRRAGLIGTTVGSFLAACQPKEQPTSPLVLAAEAPAPLTQEQLAAYPNVLRLSQDPTSRAWRAELPSSVAIVIRHFDSHRIGRVEESDGMVTRTAPDNSVQVKKGEEWTWPYYGDILGWRTEILTIHTFGKDQLLKLWVVSPEVLNRQFKRADSLLYVAAFFEHFNPGKGYFGREDFITTNWQEHPPMSVLRWEPNGLYPYA